MPDGFEAEVDEKENFLASTSHPNGQVVSGGGNFLTIALVVVIFYGRPSCNAATG